MYIYIYSKQMLVNTYKRLKKLGNTDEPWMYG